MEPRLRKKAEYTACYTRGRRYHSQHFLCFVLPQAAELTSRTGMAVSRKVGKAVARNRIKRLLREFFRLHVDMLPKGYDIAVVAKQHSADSYPVGKPSLARLEAELLPLFERIVSVRTPISR